MSTVTAVSPKPWKYLLGAVLALLILIPLWTIFVMTVIQPDSLMMQEQTMGNRFASDVLFHFAAATSALPRRGVHALPIRVRRDILRNPMPAAFI